ncbi:hypothetical protein JW898_02710 [Candidatus Woesearchaeota archaeon]|nr:hypothetical protein [Candidatus Woesearchaeota archaeon]
MSRSEDISRQIIELDESMREIASLDELYSELVSSGSRDGKELAVRKEEAAFARERMLKLSLHVKNLLTKLESHEALK